MHTFKVKKNDLLNSLQSIAGIVERRHTLPILSNVLIQRQGQTVELISSDLEIQLKTSFTLNEEDNAKNAADTDGSFKTTVSSRKLIDSLRSISGEGAVDIRVQEAKILLLGGKSRFTLQTLPAEDYPLVQEAGSYGPVFSIPQKKLKSLLQQVSFSMAIQDIRYYLNGMLFILDEGKISLVATDGNRLAYAHAQVDVVAPRQEVILPRKTVLELQRLLNDNDDSLQIQFAENQAKLMFNGFEFISKLIEGKFPNYEKVIPTEQAHTVVVDRLALQQALQKTTIIIDEKLKGIRLFFENNTLRVVSSNMEQEEVSDEIDVEYQGEKVEIGFNVSYLLDFLSSFGEEKFSFGFSDHTRSTLLSIPENDNFKYIVMPMRI